ncbi:MAG: 30S ribosomal protein THX [Chitinophagales bacterium]
MGRGDKRTKKGKIYSGSFGNIRPKKSKKNYKPAEATTTTADESTETDK